MHIDINKRIDKLENQVRSYRRLNTAILLILAGLGLTAATMRPQGAQEEIKARTIKIVDENGKMRVVLSSSKELGGYMTAMERIDKTVRFTTMSSRRGVFVTVADKTGSQSLGQISMGMELEGGIHVPSIHGAGENRSLTLSTSLISIEDPSGEITLGVNAHGAGLQLEAKRLGGKSSPRMAVIRVDQDRARLEFNGATVLSRSVR